MKIKRAPKKSPSTHAGIASFILAALAAPDDELPALLRPITTLGWAWPRTDLQHWIAPLNRFDAILEDVIRDYDLASMLHCQTNAFTPRTKALLTAILAFEKVLLENSTNRKIFASFDRLNDLLHTTDIEILLATLRLALRPAQQYSHASTGAHFGIADQRLLSLAQGWGTRDYGLEMVDLAGESVEIPPGLDEFEWQFYKNVGSVASQTDDEPGAEKKDKGKETEMDIEDEPAAPTANVTATPAPKPRAAFAAGALLATPIPMTPSTAATANTPSEGLTTVALGNVRASALSAVDLLVDAIETYDVPESERLNLLQKIRIAKSLASTEERRVMLVVRLLAVAVFSHTTSESTAQSKLFLYEPELIPQLAELVHPDRAVPIEIQTAAFYALDALAKNKNKISEVASALNASVSHGILMYVLRRTVNDLAGENPISTPEFIDSLFNILTFFQTSAFVGNMIVGAGIVLLFVEIVKNQRRDRIPVVTRSIIFLDSLMYGYSAAFTLFGTAGGLAIFVERVKDEIELCIAAHGKIAAMSDGVIDAPTGLLSFEQAALLKALLRALQRLMQTAGTTEGLRNLIDTSLLASIKSVMVNRVIFGPQLFALAINISATFVHNEPTCLTVLQDAKIPDALYDAIEGSIPSSIDVLQAIPNAIGALCLNPAGLAQFNARPIISQLFTIFSSEKHVRILQDRDNGTMVGAAFDELIRHHPTLKDKVFEATVEALTAIRTLGEAFVPPGTGAGYNLQLVSDFAASAPSAEVPIPSTGADTAMADATSKIEEPKENHVLMCIDVMGRFLEGLFQNLAHCKDFVKLEPYNLMLDLFSLPCTPYLMPGTSAFVSMCSAMRIISEVKAPEVVDAILVRVKSSLECSRPIWSEFSPESKTKYLTEPTPETMEEHNTMFRVLSSLLSYTGLLSDVYANLSYTHGRLASTVLLALCNPAETEILLQLGELYRFSVWESLLLNKVSSPTKAATPVAATGIDATSSTAVELASKDEISTISAASAHAPNVKSLHDVISSIPVHITPFLQSVIKLFVHRRSSELGPHRKASAHLSKIISAIMVHNILWLETEDVSSRLAYSNAMMTNVSALLFDDRSSQPGAQVLLVNMFNQLGGMEAYVALYKQLHNTITVALVGAEEGSKPELGLAVVQAFAGLKIALDLFQRLSLARTILESSQTTLLLSREKDRTSPDFFDPHELLSLLRAGLVPAVVETWTAPWLAKSPSNVVRSLVSTILNIIRAEGENPEEGGTAPSASMGISRSFFMAAVPGLQPAAAGGAGGAGPFVLDEAKVSQLTDMGFPRRAAETALTRCRNNLNIATEYLLSHPDVVGSARVAEAEALSSAEVELVNGAVVPALEDPPAAVAAPDVAEPVYVPPTPVVDEQAVPSADVEMTEAAPAADALVESIPGIRRVTASLEAVKVALESARGSLRQSFLKHALDLAEQFPEIVFEIKGAFNVLGPDGSDNSTTGITDLINDLNALVDGDALSPAQILAAATRFRLAALLATDAVYREAIEGTRTELMQVLLKFCAVYLKDAPDKDARPAWLASAMLVTDSLLSLAEVSLPTTILAAGDAPPSVDLVGQGPAWRDERVSYFDLALDVLAKGISTREVFISTLRLLLVLTRDHEQATAFVARDGLRLLFSSFVTERVETEGCRPYAVMILRHVVESKEILLPMMEREIEAWFGQPRAKVADITAFLRGAGSIAFRNVPIFLEATRATCKLVQADSAGHYHVALLHDPQPAGKGVEPEAPLRSLFAGDGSAAATTEMQVDEPAKAVSKLGMSSGVESVETALHFLMTEVLDATKAAMAPPPVVVAAPATPSAAGSSSEVVLVATDVKKDVDVVEPPLDDHFKAAFSMSCLAEMVSSYSICKTSFFSFAKRAPKEVATAPVKLRSSFLHHLLTEVIPVSSMLLATDPATKRRVQLSQWASLVVVGLCYDADAANASKESSADLTTIRKVVLDAIAKSFKDAAASTEPTGVRYGRLFTLSDLCSRLLTCRPYPSTSKLSDETSMQLAKLMLEKNFAVILTNALADVDLNFPSVTNLINSILRPLEQLTKVVTKVGRAKPTVPAAGELDDASTGSSDLDEEQEVDTEEDEALDLYRNSALGMYEGELEPGHMEDAYMSGSSADEYDEDDEDMEDIDDGLLPDSDVSDVSDDEDERQFVEGLEDMTTDEHEDDDGDSDEEGDSVDELDMGDEMDDEDVLITGDEDGDQNEEDWEDQPDDLLEALENEEGGMTAQEMFDRQGGLLIDDDANSDEDSLTDQEEIYLEGELEFDAEMTEQLAAPQSRATGWGNFGDFGRENRRRGLTDDMMQLNDSLTFGRSRGNGGAGSAASHPLLMDTPSGGTGTDAPSRRQRGDGSRGTPEYNAWVQSIEQMLGGGAIEQLQQLLSAHGMARIDSPNQIRIQPNTGPEGGLAVVLDPAPQPLAAPRPGAGGRAQAGQAAPRASRHPTERAAATGDFYPVTTVQRWQEEGRICQGSVLAAERIARLVNHVINELHGPARLIAEQTRAEDAAREVASDSIEPPAPEVLSDDSDDDEGRQDEEPAAMEGVMDDDVTEVMNLARSLAASLAPPSSTPAQAPTPPVVEAAAPVEAPVVVDTPAEPAPVEAAPVEANAEAGGSVEAARVTIEIHGETVDITDTGIDPTFLEALPDDMREEVLNQHFREFRPAAPPQAVPSSINSEFLDALPPHLRAEVLRQEAAEQRREQDTARAAARASGGAYVEEEAVGPVEIDPASFFASLDPQLRQSVLLEQEDGFIQSLPASLAAEANVLRAAGARRAAARAAIEQLQQPAAAPVAAKKAVPHREVIQLLDKSGLATLVRLLFFPQPLRRNALQKVLVNLCENSRTRMELINLLLTILQDGTRDVSAVDKSFSQMSLRASKSLGTKETPRRRGAEAPGGSLPHFPGESVPNLIAQRCLEALSFLVTANEQSPLFFLTEQEIVVGLNRRSSKKGKGKEKAVPSTTYPVIVLLGLLDRPAILKTQSMLESLTLLLSSITKTLSVLQKKALDATGTAAAVPVAAEANPLEVAPVEAASTEAAAGPSASTSAETAPALPKDTKDLTPGDVILQSPPVLPAAVIRLVVNVLDAGECSGKTFQQTLILIQNLSYLPEAREVISEELKSRAQGLCSLLIPDLDELLAAIQSTDDVRGVTLAKFSPASSLQAKLLRILKTIDWIHSPPKKGASAATDEEDPMSTEHKKLTDGEEKVSAIYESFTAAGLWQHLGNCLAGIEAKPELLFIATVLLPLIESLMVVSKYVGAKRGPRDVVSPREVMSPREMGTPKPESMESIFLAFTDEHRKILNTMVRNNPTLMSGSFAILVHNPKVLEFDNKRSYFFSRLHDRTQRQRNHYPALQVNVRRQYVFEDSFHNLQRRSGDEIKYGKLSVRFYDEEGVDAGGVTREWFSVLARQMFNPGYALFQPQAADALTYQPNKSSSINPEHLLFFKFVGRIIGKALHDQRLLEAYFSRSVYKHMLGKPVDHRDLESIDPEYHKSLVWMLENDIDGVLDLTFSVERDDFGITEIVDLVPDGRNVAVTNENKAEYVRLIADHRLSAEIKDQISALLKGLYEIVPKEVLQIFSERELELLISGLPEIDVDEWRANTDLHNFSASDPVIGYFWRAVRSFTHEERAKLLQFVSGSSRVPLEGFSSLQGMSGITKFSITSAGTSQGLPTAHTCFNQLDLPNRYESYEELRKALLTAITEGADGFGFV